MGRSLNKSLGSGKSTGGSDYPSTAPVVRKMLLGREEDPKVLRVWEGVCVRLDRRVALNPGTVPACWEFCVVRAPWVCDMIN
jgi:hypothetical protein